MNATEYRAAVARELERIRAADTPRPVVSTLHPEGEARRDRLADELLDVALDSSPGVRLLVQLQADGFSASDVAYAVDEAAGRLAFNPFLRGA